MNNSLIGKTIRSRYHIVKQIGAGNSGVTFVAQDRQRFNDPCVVKQFQPRETNPEALKVARRLFNSEAEILGKLGDSDRIPRLLAYFEENRDFFIVQELVQGDNLESEIELTSPFSEAKVLDLLEDVLSILVFVQQHGVIHRDIKPSNLIRRASDGKIILIDFGSVKQVSLDPQQVPGYQKPTIVVGTENYIPIEQAMGNPGFYSDIHALGIVAVQAITGKLPKDLKSDRNNNLLWHQAIPTHQKYRSGLIKAIDKAIQYRYQDRYPSAQDFLADIKKLRSSNTKVASVSSPKKTVARTKTIQVGFCSLLLLAASTLLLRFWKEPEIPYLSYVSDDYGMELDYPEAWTLSSRDDFLLSGVMAASPLEDAEDFFRENISVLVERVGENTSLEDYTIDSISEIRNSGNFTLLDTQGYSLGDRDAVSAVYRGEERNVEIKRMQLWTVAGDKAYIITFTAQPEEYERYFPIAKKVIDSFQLLPSTQN